MDSRAIYTAGPRGLLRRAWAIDRPLTLVGLAMAVVLAVALAGLVLDPRVVTGAPAWLKPAKFAISIAIYSFTLVWLLTFIQDHPRLVRLVSWVTAGAFAVEMVLIAAAAALGTTSHFDISSPAHSAVWSTMGAAIVVIWVANLTVSVLLLRQHLPDPTFAWSLRLGVAISAVGMGVAYFMTSPTADQLAAARAGAGRPIAGAHSVGVADGGPGLPIVGWSTVGGDLRAAHFVGLHALQLIPLLGFILSRVGPSWLRSAHRTALVWTAGLSYLALVALITWQALRGQPLIRPDALTLGVLVAIIVAAGGATVAIIVRAMSTPAMSARRG